MAHDAMVGTGRPASARVPIPRLAPGIDRRGFSTRGWRRRLRPGAEADTADARYLEQGPPWPMTAQVALTIERTVQEGLTNARKHAPGSAVTVALHYGDEVLRVEVVDTGPSGAANGHDHSDSGGGYGLGGMRERAALIGAELRTGREGKGYRICLTVPRAALSAS